MPALIHRWKLNQIHKNDKIWLTFKEIEIQKLLRRSFLKYIYIVLLITILASCGGNSSNDTNSAVTWTEAESLIDSYMKLAEQDFQKSYNALAGTRVAFFAASGASSPTFASIVASEADVPVDDFIEDVHQYVFNLAVTRRIDRDGMTQLMEKYRQSQISYVEDYVINRYGQSNFDNNVGVGVENLIGNKFDKELLVMAQLW